MDAEQAVAELLAHHIGPALRTEGFSRRRGHFNKWVGPNCEAVSMVRHRFVGPKMRRFHIRLGVYYPDYMRLVAPGKPPTFIAAWDTLWDAELGHLSPERRQRIWTVQGETPLPPIAEEVIALLRTYGLPLLERCADESHLVERLSEGKVIGLPEFQRLKILALKLTQAGRSGEAHRVLQECKMKFPDARRQLDDYSTKLETM